MEKHSQFDWFHLNEKLGASAWKGTTLRSVSYCLMCVNTGDGARWKSCTGGVLVGSYRGVLQYLKAVSEVGEKAEMRAAVELIYFLLRTTNYCIVFYFSIHACIFTVSICMQ